MSVDERFMRYALQLARTREGRTGENPSVGCVIVKDGHVIAATATAFGGRPHAEAQALEQAGDKARGATVYVTLEPCAHHGQTPPCAEALIKAQVARVVIGCLDADPRVAGKGLELLKNNNIEHKIDVLNKDVASFYQGFFRRVTVGKPYVIVKVATSLDGCIATRSGQSQWITCEAARAHGQQLRSRVDGLITGIGTILADNPQLTCRLQGLQAFSPIRIILDRQARLPEVSNVVRDNSVPTWRFGITPLPYILPKPHAEYAWDGSVDALLSTLAKNGLNRVMVEAGASVTSAFLRLGVVDEIYWYRGASVLGGDAMPMCDALGIDSLVKAPNFNVHEHRTFENTQLVVYKKQYV